MAAAADTETRTAQPELFDLTGKVAIITGSSAASARRSPSAWPSTGPRW